MTEEQEYHYYASTLYGWGVGNTPEAALAECVKSSGGSAQLKRAIKENGKGMVALLCRVDLPKKAHYSINNYLPEFVDEGLSYRRKVPRGRALRVFIATMKGALIFDEPGITWERA